MIAVLAHYMYALLVRKRLIAQLNIDHREEKLAGLVEKRMEKIDNVAILAHPISYLVFLLVYIGVHLAYKPAPYDVTKFF